MPSTEKARDGSVRVEGAKPRTAALTRKRKRERTVSSSSAERLAGRDPGVLAARFGEEAALVAGDENRCLVASGRKRRDRRAAAPSGESEKEEKR